MLSSLFKRRNSINSGSKFRDVETIINTLESVSLYPDIRVIQGRSTGENVIINGSQVKLFCGYDYLGLSNNQDIIRAIKKGLDEYGIQSGGTPLVSGTLDIHKTAEASVSDLVGSDTSLLFTSGALANIGVIPAITNVPFYTASFVLRKMLKIQVDPEIYSDELNHATIVDACRIARAKKVVFRHKDMNQLNDLISKSKSPLKLIVSDGVFSMDGDIAPLNSLLEISKKHNAMLMIDDAHAVGVLGENGGGTAEHLGVKGSIDITTGALGKAVGILGGYAAVSETMAKYLRISARPAIFSGSLPPSLACGLNVAVGIVSGMNEERKKLWEVSNYLRKVFKNNGYDTFLSEDPTPIVPLLIGDDEKAIIISKKLQEAGIFAPAIRWPAVPKGTARIRFTLQITNTLEDCDVLVSHLNKLFDELKIKSK